MNDISRPEKLPRAPGPLIPWSTTGLLALVAGAAGIGFAPIWIRQSQLGPAATAAHRMLLAAPLLFLWTLMERPQGSNPQIKLSNSDVKWLFAAGFFFAGDMALWSWSLHLTTVANSTLITNLTPLIVMIAARVLLGESVRRSYFVGMPVAFLGAFLLVRASSVYNPAHLKGDFVSALATLFYAGYLLTLRHLRGRLSAARALSHSGWVSAVLLFGVAALTEKRLLPFDTAGWLPLIALAAISQVGGQGLIAYGFGHVPAAIGSLVLLVQPIVASLLAWGLLGERLGSIEIFGGLLILTGITITIIQPRSSPATGSLGAEVPKS